MTKEQPSPLIDYQKLVNVIYYNENFNFVGVALQENSTDQKIRWRYAAGNQGERFRKIVLRPGIGIAGLVIRTGKPYWDNYVANKNYADYMYRPITKIEKLTAVAAVPIFSNKASLVTGVLLGGYRDDHVVNKFTVYLLQNYLSGAATSDHHWR